MYLLRNLSSGCIILLASLYSGNATGQEKNPLIDSRELIKKGSELHDQKKYREAIRIYQQIDKSDTNYVDALHEISYSYYADSQLNKSLEQAELAMKLFPERYSKFSMIAANALDDLKQVDKAIAYYDSAIKLNNKDYLLYYNKGIVSYNSKNYEVAKAAFQQSLLINPYYSNSHYFLGNSYLFEGSLVPAILAYKTYLLMDPEGKYTSSAVSALNQIATVTDEIKDVVKKRKTPKPDSYQLQQEILLSKVALDPKYKLKTSLEDNIVRQIQVVDEKLEYIRNDKEFAMQFYVPYYIEVFKSGDFEPMVYTIFSGLKIKQIESWLKNNKKDKQAFIDKSSPYFDKIKSSQILDKTDREKSEIIHLFNNGILLGKGKISNDKKQVAQGKWEYYHNNGKLKAAGMYDEEGNKTGSWIYYHENGAVKEKYNYVAGTPDKLAEGWFRNGNKWYSDTYQEGKLTGIQTVNFFNGLPNRITGYKEDKKEGEEKYFDFKGNYLYSAIYKNDIAEGPSKSYYPTGKLKSEVTYKNGKEEGTFKEYYESGKLNLQGELKNGMRQGLWTSFYEDGSVREKTNYVDNEIIGEFTEYYSNGQLGRKGSYYRKKIDGKMESYDEDGKLFSEAVYDKGRLKEIRFIDKNGNEIATTTTRKGAADITFYSAEGLKTSEGYYNKAGERDGKFIDYYGSGKISTESNWKDGVRQGEEKTYFSNGKVKKISNYKDGEEDGYVKEFYVNGKLSSEGWRVEGKKQQKLLFYNVLGDLTAAEYFINDDLDGYAQYYDPNNRLKLEFKHSNGWIEEINQFDSTGKILSANKFVKGEGTLIYKNPNGKNSAVGNYKNYMLNGPYNYYFHDGTLSASSFYRNDVKDSSYTSYYFGGKKAAEGKYTLGKKTGSWKYYFSNGKLKEEEIYRNGNFEGEDKIYFEDGSLDKILTYKNDELNGPYDVYSANQQLAVRLNFKNDILISYQYEEKPGVFIKPIIIKGGSGKIEAKFPNGKTSFVTTFKDNVQHGSRTVYYPGGSVFYEGSRNNGFHDGVLKTYYPTGQVWKEETYVIGEAHGQHKTFYPNGKPESVENYYDGDLHGINKYYDAQGKVKTIQYYYGAIVSVN